MNQKFCLLIIKLNQHFLKFQVSILLLIAAVTAVLIHLQTTLNLDKTLVENIQILNYGITEFEIPTGWFATESMNGDNGIILTMLPGTTEEFFTKLNSLSNNETLPVMNLVVQDKEDLRERQMSSSLSAAGPSSFHGVYRIDLKFNLYDKR